VVCGSDGWAHLVAVLTAMIAAISISSSKIPGKIVQFSPLEPIRSGERFREAWERIKSTGFYNAKTEDSPPHKRGRKPLPPEIPDAAIPGEPLASGIILCRSGNSIAVRPFLRQMVAD